MHNREVLQRSPNTIAYIGDAVLELYVRERLVAEGAAQPSRLHKLAVNIVSAKGQAAAYDVLLAQATEQEISILKRGRNAQSAVPKNASVKDYRYATAVEYLIGYLHLSGDTQRLQQILDTVYSTAGVTPANTVSTNR